MNRRLVLCLAWMAAAAGATACSPESQTVGEKTAPDWTPDCDVRGFPCTWKEVAEETATRSHAIGEVASLMMFGGATAEEVASFLAEDSTVAEIEIYGSRVRFRLDGGRPSWILPPDEFDHHRPGAAQSRASAPEKLAEEHEVAAIEDEPAHSGPSLMRRRWQGIARWLEPRDLIATPALASAQSNEVLTQGVAAREPGTGKRALVISPFGWQWMGPIANNAYRSLRLVRDYRSEEGGEVTYHADSDSLADETPEYGQRLWTDNVLFDDFLHWNDYNVVLLVTHGWVRKCDSGTTQTPVPAPGRRRPGDRSPWTVYDRKWEEVWDGHRDADDPNASVNEFEYCPVVWAGRPKGEGYEGYPGVEVVHWKPPLIVYGDERPEEPATRHPTLGWERLGDDEPSHPGLTREEAQWCRAEMDRGVENPTTAGGRKPCTLPGWKYQRRMVGLTMPFFRAQYPQGLDNTIAFVAACFAGFNYYLLDHLTGFDRGPGNENVAAFGWFARGLLPGDYDTAIPKMIELLGSGYHSWKMLNEMRLVSRQLVGRAFGSPGGSGAAAHGRDVVELIVPTARTELRDGGSVRVRGAPGDGEPDSLDLRATIVGVSDEAALREIKLRVREINEPRPTQWLDPTKETGKVGAFEATQPAPLGRDHREGEKVDLEIHAELPGGGESLWVYEDIVLTSAACSWSGSMGGAAVGGGEIGGLWGTARSNDSRSPPLFIDATVQDGDPQVEAPWLVISLTNQATTPRYSEFETWREIKLAIPGVRPGATGTFKRVWGTLWVGDEEYDGNAEYLRRDVIGLPEGTGIGRLLTTDVTLTRYDDERVEGTFKARFLDLDRIPLRDRTPPGLGIHTFPDAEIQASGEFSILLDGSCRTRASVQRMRQ